VYNIHCVHTKTNCVNKKFHLPKITENGRRKKNIAAVSLISNLSRYRLAKRLLFPDK